MWIHPFSAGAVLKMFCLIYHLMFTSRLFYHSFIREKTVHTIAGSDGMSKRQRHLYYICNFLVFAALAMVNTVMIPYMKAVGYSLMQQSVILAANALIAIIGQFLSDICAIGIIR